jgi:hypothetical protein
MEFETWETCVPETKMTTMSNKEIPCCKLFMNYSFYNCTVLLDIFKRLN